VPRVGRREVRAIAQMALMAAIVATLGYWPIGIAAALALAALGVPLESSVTFGGALNRCAGMAAWWLVFFAPSLVYAALAFPWEQMRDDPRAGWK
jgi:hypothetical protein